MRFIEKLRQYRIERLALKRSAANNNQICCLDTSASLLPEAEVSNHSGNPDHIRIGRNSHVRGHLLTYGHGGRISIGDWSYVGARTEIWSMNSISIGKRVLIAHDVNIHDGTAHSINHVERHEHYRRIIETGHPRTLSELPGIYSSPIVIEDDVWISFGVTILRGVKIGKRSVIAAGSMVTQDVPPDSLYRCQIIPVITPINKTEKTDLHFGSTNPTN